jgi:hypothetical protein
VPYARLHHRQEPLVADERVDNQDGPDDQHEALQSAASAPGGPARKRLNGGGIFIHGV